jgi:Skp family chaperone for outer membrane proteins
VFGKFAFRSLQTGNPVSCINLRSVTLGVVAFGGIVSIHPAAAQSTMDAQINAIEQQIKQLQKELAQVKANLASRDRELKAAQDKSRVAQDNARMAQAKPQAAQANAEAAQTQAAAASAQAAQLSATVQSAQKVAAAAPPAAGPPAGPPLPLGTFRVGGVTVTLGGFTAREGVYRSRNQAAGNDSNFNTGIPLPNNPNYNISEFRATAQQSRFSLLAQGKVNDATTLTSYMETDFLSAGSSSNSNQSNSYTLRLHQF